MLFFNQSFKYIRKTVANKYTIINNEKLANKIYSIRNIIKSFIKIE